MNAFRFCLRLARCLPLALWLCGVTPGHANETVRQVQEELRKRDLYFGDIDGRATPQVSAAVRSYQQRKGFSPTGELDDTTLRSLQLLPALPAKTIDLIPSATAASAEPPAATPWPDITVLRSDEARRSAPPTPAVSGGGSPTVSSPTASPPAPPPAGEHRRAELDTVRDFLHRYLLAGQTNDTAAELEFYSDHVDYFNEGVVDKHFIENDVNRYDHRWPQRHFTLLEPLTLGDAPDGSPDKLTARFRLAFANKNARYAVEGAVDDTFILVRSGPESYRIASMKEQRVRQH